MSHSSYLCHSLHPLADGPTCLPKEKKDLSIPDFQQTSFHSLYFLFHSYFLWSRPSLDPALLPHSDAPSLLYFYTPPLCPS